MNTIGYVLSETLRDSAERKRTFFRNSESSAGISRRGSPEPKNDAVIVFSMYAKLPICGTTEHTTHLRQDAPTAAPGACAHLQNVRLAAIDGLSAAARAREVASR